MPQPLTDAINALTTYANTVTGASDTTLSDAVATLASGYGGGGSYTYYDYIMNTAVNTNDIIIKTGLNGVYCSADYGHDFTFAIPEAVTSNSNGVYGYRARTGETQTRGCWLQSTSLAFNYNGVDTGYVYPLSVNTKYKATTKDGKIYINDEYQRDASGTYTAYAGTSSICLFGFATNTTDSTFSQIHSQIKIYGFRVWNCATGVDVANLVPCTNEDGVAGFYDTVRRKFFTSWSPTKLTAGNDE